MRLVEEFALEPLAVTPGREAYEDRRSRLLHQERNTGTVVPGTVLEAQIAVDGGWLLFTTHDIPAEEGLEISLIDRSCKLVDSAALYWPYATGTFKNLVLASEDTVTFDFFGDHRWRVKVFGAPRLRPPLAWLIEPRGVHRRFGFSRRFAVGTA